MKKWLLLGLMIVLLQYTINTFANVPKAEHFLVINDIHLHPFSTYSMQLHPLSETFLNDCDEGSFQKMMDLIASQIKTGTIPQPQFVIYLGDAAGHVRIGRHFVWNNEVTLFKKFIEVFPNIPILYVFGNNDSFEKNYGLFSEKTKSGEALSPLVAASHVENWQNGFISQGGQCVSSDMKMPCILSENKTLGFYAAYLKPKFKFIGLNTVLLSYWHVPAFQSDIEKQFTWLKQQLHDAKLRHERVLIGMHIPPGKNLNKNQPNYREYYSDRMVELFAEYHEQIMGVLAAHTHMDEMKLIQTSDGKNLLPVYISPALSTSHLNAPAIRSYEYHQFESTWTLTDYTTFRIFWNNHHQLSLGPLYRFRDVFCQLPSQEMNQCLTKNVADKIEQYYTAGNDDVVLKIRYPENIWLSTQSRH